MSNLPPKMEAIVPFPTYAETVIHVQGYAAPVNDPPPQHLPYGSNSHYQENPYQQQYQQPYLQHSQDQIYQSQQQQYSHYPPNQQYPAQQQFQQFQPVMPQQTMFQQQLTPQPHQNGILRIEYLPAGLCADCWACCACCWVLPQPQPDSWQNFEIIIDDNNMGKLKQGQTSEWVLSPGSHRVTLGKTGVGGFLSGLFGDRSAISTVIDIPAASTVKYEIGYKINKCGNRRNHVVFFERAAHQ